MLRTLALITLSAMVCGCGSESGSVAKKPAVLDNAKNPLVTIVTNQGTVQIELFEDQAPNTVANFVKLADSSYYEGIMFHRIIKGFMVQGGCPETKGWNSLKYGTGGPGYTFADEFSQLTNKKGYVSMANSGPATNGSQFFILFGDAPHLDGKHTVFGKITPETQAVVDRWEKELVPEQGEAPKSTLKIESTHVDRRRNHPYEPKVTQQ